MATKRVKYKTKSKRRLGLAGSAVGIVGGLAGMHRAQQF